MTTLTAPRPTRQLAVRPAVAGRRVVRTRVRWDRVAALAVALLAFVWFLGAGLAGSSGADAPPAPPVVVVVQPGDTVWDLARAHAPADMATLEYAMLVEQHNGVRAGALLPGSVLELPVPRG